MLQNFIDQLGQELDMKALISSNDEHSFHLPFDQDIDVDAIELEKSLLFKGIIGTCPEQNKDAFLLRTMEANLFGLGTRGATIGLNEDGKLLTLSLELDYNSSFKDFKEKLEDFVNVIDYWRREALKHE